MVEYEIVKTCRVYYHEEIKEMKNYFSCRQRVILICFFYFIPLGNFYYPSHFYTTDKMINVGKISTALHLQTLNII